SAQFAIIIGENELSTGLITLKSLKNKDFGQKELKFDEFIEQMREFK
ncbi:hypothetical protein MNBD_GAMMA01-1250, partial [hydrothermal vent metagenome]